MKTQLRNRCKSLCCVSESLLSRTQVFERHKAFNEDRVAIENLPHVSRLTTSWHQKAYETTQHIKPSQRRLITGVWKIGLSVSSKGALKAIIQIFIKIPENVVFLLDRLKQKSEISSK